MMKILALIPARSGSKRLPGKNIRIFGGKPLINWSIEVAKEIPAICDVLVSTDDSQIASIAEAAGASVPWLRPKDIAADDTPSIEVALHALNWYESMNGEIDGLLLLQPTSPLRSKTTIQKGIDLFETHERKSVIGVSHVQNHPMWTLRQAGDYITPFFDSNEFELKEQDLPQAFVVNGSFFLSSPEVLRRNKKFMELMAVPLLSSSLNEDVDIDTIQDFERAEEIYSNHYLPHK